MKLIIILLCIGVQRYMHLNSFSHRMNWFAPYFEWLTSKIKFVNEGHGILGLLITILPLLLIVTLVFAVVLHLLTPVGYYLLSAVFVWYYLDARDLLRYPYEIQTADNYITASYPQLFGVLFWYYIFTPVGLALYVIVIELRRYLELYRNDQQQSLYNYSVLLQNILDWIPLRLTCFAFALVSHFASAIKIISTHLLNGFEDGFTILSKTGKACLPTEATLAEVVSLIDRSLVVWLVVMAFITIGRWLG